MFDPLDLTFSVLVSFERQNSELMRHSQVS
jgi:hypothetical protein